MVTRFFSSLLFSALLIFACTGLWGEETPSPEEKKDNSQNEKPDINEEKKADPIIEKLSLYTHLLRLSEKAEFLL